MIVAIDIGMYKVSCVVGGIDNDTDTATVTIKSASFVKSEGFHNGMVSDVDKATHTIRTALKKCEDVYGRSIRKYDMWCSISGLQSTTDWVKKTVKVQGKYVSSFDISHAINTAVQSVHQDDKTVIHILPFSYILNGQRTRTPRKMMADTLQAEVLVCHAQKSVVNNLQSVFEDCGCQWHRIALGGHMAGLALLDPQEKELSFVMVLDMGASVTSATIYYQGHMVWYKSFPFGVDEISRYIMEKCSVSYETAERLKQDVYAWEPALDLSTKNKAPTYARVGENDTNEYTSLTIGDMTGFVQRFYTEHLQTVRDTIPSHYAERLGRLIITGGGAKIHSMDKLAHSVFKMNVRLGMLYNIYYPNNLEHKDMISPIVVGLIKYSAQHVTQQEVKFIQDQNTDYNNLSTLQRTIKWIRVSL